MRQKEIMTHILIALRNFNSRFTLLLYSSILLVLLAPGFIPALSYAGGVPLQAMAERSQTSLDAALEPVPNAAQSLLEGKNSIERCEYEKAITLLTAAYEKLPVLGDYALLWRSRAYEGMENSDKALEDLKSIKEKYTGSPLLKQARLKEMELLKKKGDPSVGGLLEGLLKDYPSDMEIKYAYAQYLKGINDLQRAKELFREVFISTCSLSANALNELSSSDITVADLAKKGKALNAALRFEEAEKVNREALALYSGSPHKADEKSLITDSLAYSLFMQKRYREAAELYKDTNNSLWRARSILRAGDIDTFQSELPEFVKTADKRMAGVMLAYGAMKRRAGKSGEAFDIFSSVLSHYPAAREEALWATGWTYYVSGDYKKASKVLSQLAATYGDPKYLYWSRKCRQLLGDKEPPNPYPDQENDHDFYGYLTCLKNKHKPQAIIRTSLRPSLNSHLSERVDILSKIGLKDEAASELLLLSKKDPSPGDLISISSYLQKLGIYKTAVALVSRVPYSEELHELYYPLAFWPEVEEASTATSLDPYLILSVMREESRFEPGAQSVAGAIGLMQLMPRTAHLYSKNMKVNLKNSPGLHNAGTNIMLGSYYLMHLLNKFGSVPLALAAYNGGEDAVNDWMKTGKYRTVDEFIEDIPYGETRIYVKKVMTTYFEYLRSNRGGDVSLAHNHIGEL